MYGYEGNFKEAITTGEGFISIGIAKEEDEVGFAGTFDGNGKIINNLKIYVPNRGTVVYKYYGLFGVNSGVIKKIGLKNVAIDVEGLTCGSICGCNNGEIDSCWSSGSINGGARVGGISGTGKESVIKNCYNLANVSGVMKSGWDCAVGGILGSTNTTIVENCYNLGQVSGANVSKNVIVGGIVGYTNAVVKNSYNVGKINGNRPDGPYVGGVVGHARSNVDKVCNIGEITYEGQTKKYVATLVGAINGSLSNSYALTNSELNGIGRNYSSTPEPTKVDSVSQMPSILEIVGEAFKEDTYNINNGYPVLNWQ